MTHEKRLMTAILACLFAVGLVSCNPNQGASAGSEEQVENEFKSVAAEYKPVLVGFEEVASSGITDQDEIRTRLKEDGLTDEEVERFIDEGRPLFDKSLVTKYYEDNKARWLVLSDRLDAFYNAHPDSRWADDSLFLMTLMPYIPDISSETNAAIKKALGTLIMKPVKLEVEPWTMENFGEIGPVKAMKDMSTWLPPDVVDFNEKCYAMYKLSFALMLINDGDSDKAERLLGELSAAYPGGYMEKVAQNEIEKLEKPAEMTTPGQQTGKKEN